MGTPGSSQDPASPTGWFPAKFVEVLDERSKEVRGTQCRAAPGNYCCLHPGKACTFLARACVLSKFWLLAVNVRPGRGLQVWAWGFSDPIPQQYSIAGDDTVTEGVTDLVRGTLCPALKALFEHGLKKPSLLGGACHPWLFIEEVSQWLDPCSPLSFSPSPWALWSLCQGLMGW